MFEKLEELKKQAANYSATVAAIEAKIKAIEAQVKAKRDEITAALGAGEDVASLNRELSTLGQELEQEQRLLTMIDDGTLRRMAPAVYNEMMEQVRGAYYKDLEENGKVFREAEAVFKQAEKDYAAGKRQAFSKHQAKWNEYRQVLKPLLDDQRGQQILERGL